MTYYLNDRSFPFNSYQPDENNVQFFVHYKDSDECIMELKKQKNYRLKEVEDIKVDIEELDIKIKKLENNK